MSISYSYTNVYTTYQITINPIADGGSHITATANTRSFNTISTPLCYEPVQISFKVDPNVRNGMFARVYDYQVSAQLCNFPARMNVYFADMENDQPVISMFVNDVKVVRLRSFAPQMQIDLYSLYTPLLKMRTNQRRLDDIIKSRPSIFMDPSGSIMRDELIQVGAVLASGFYTDVACEIIKEVTPLSALRTMHESYDFTNDETGPCLVPLAARGCIWCMGSPHNIRCPRSTLTLARYAGAAPCGGCGYCAACAEYVSYSATVDRVVAAAAPF